MPIGVAVEAFDGQPLYVNPALCLMLGFNEEELRCKHCVDFSPPEDAEKRLGTLSAIAGTFDRSLPTRETLFSARRFVGLGKLDYLCVAQWSAAVGCTVVRCSWLPSWLSRPGICSERLGQAVANDSPHPDDG